MSSLQDWLSAANLAAHAHVFAEHEITLDDLPHLTDADIDGLGLPIGPRRRLKVALEALKATPPAPTPVAPAPPATPEPPTDLERTGSWLHDSGIRVAERRQLTVMFCDLVGSTVLAEKLDPEELLELMKAYRGACTEVVERYEGHVAQYLGDGLMVYFGWPRAHEDDAERGVRAALEMVEAVQAIRAAEALAVRIGLATGPVVVGDPAKHDVPEASLAIGKTPNLAARLQSLAGSDEVVIAPTTRRLVVDTFALTDLGAHPLKGIAEPVTVWRVDGARRTEGRFRAARGNVELTPLVGRERETTALLRRWQQARELLGQVVLIAGPAGIGKSRLTQGLRERLSG